MDITFDFSFFYELLDMPVYQALWTLFIRGGWIIILIVFLRVAWEGYIRIIQEKYRQEVKHTLLAIDVPKENTQGPKAVEHIFANLAAAQSSGNLVDKYIKGYNQQPFSLEIISIGGYVQFLIRTPEKLKDLAEAAVYAQYPDAEINEVDDYTENMPGSFPNEEYDLWGSELILYAKEAFPIRTYPQFVEPMTKDELKFKDPMASILEVLSRASEGEQIWMQLIITPVKGDWKDKCANDVKKALGQKVETKRTIIDEIIDSPVKLLEYIGDVILSRPAGKEETKEKQAGNLSPGEMDVVKAMQNKLSKIGFKSKFRIIYLAKKEFFNKPKAVSSILGAIQQFNSLNTNGFKPDSKTKTGADYFFVERRVASRQRKIMANYKKRSNVEGATPYILNTEELATLYHFPVSEVKIPLLKKVETKRGGAPSVLPTAEVFQKDVEESDGKGLPPANLPIIK